MYSLVKSLLFFHFTEVKGKLMYIDGHGEGYFHPTFNIGSSYKKWDLGALLIICSQFLSIFSYLNFFPKSTEIISIKVV